MAETEKKIRKTVSFTIASKISWWVTLTKQVKHSYDKGFKSLKKDIEDNIRSW